MTCITQNQKRHKFKFISTFTSLRDHGWVTLNILPIFGLRNPSFIQSIP